MWVLAVVAAIVLLHGLVFETFTVPSASMEPTLRPGDRIVVWKIDAHDVHRGEIVVFNGTDVFTHPGQASPGGISGWLQSLGNFVGFRPEEDLFVKRIVGLPGDHLVVGKSGTLQVNGVTEPEPYLPRGMQASTVPFDVVVPAGDVFVMGDNRPDSDDSRAHLGDPGGGMVPIDTIVGKVTVRYWPTASWGRLHS